MPLPIRMAVEFPAQLYATPIEDIDPFYSDKKVHSTRKPSDDGARKSAVS